MEVGANASVRPDRLLRQWLGNKSDSLRARVVGFVQTLKKVGEDDPRRVTHCLKEGLAITLVSLFYYLKPLYDGFGSNAMWAVLTVVVVFDFSVGGTLGKGLLRLLATMVGGAAGLGIHRISALAGERAEPMILGFIVFTIAAMVTYIRFIPAMKAKYDYGLLIFILTFSMVAVSGYREEELLKMAHQRILTIVIGCVMSVVVCISIFPVWIGADLHNHVSLNIEKLANFLQGFGNECFKIGDQNKEEKSEKSFLEGYKSVLTSKSNEETMANLASWEPAHGKFRFCHPWKQYVKVATLTRQCAYKFEALNVYLNSPLIQTSHEVRTRIHDPCIKICSEASMALRETTSMLRKMTRPSSKINIHVENTRIAVEDIKSVLKTGSWEESNLMEMAQTAAIAMLLNNVVTNVEEIVRNVNELAHLAKFNKPRTEPIRKLHQGTVQPISSVHGPSDHEHVVTIDESSPSTLRATRDGGEIESEDGCVATLCELMERHSK